MKSIESLVRKNIASLCPYSTARDECTLKLGIFLDANESPYQNGWNRYPDPRQKELKARISEIKGIPSDNIFIGNGSDEAIDLVFRVFCEPGKDNVVAICPSYGMYTVSAAINDIEVREVLLGEEFSLPVDALLAACDSNTKAMFICSPNNPTGNAFQSSQILDLMERFDGIVVVDEAYAHFSDVPSLLPKVCDAGNLLILQTMSKARGMAALRLGMAFSSKRIISLMSMVKYPYNINLAAQQIALDMLKNPVDEQVEEIKQERARLFKELPEIACVEKVYPSDANFLLVKTADADAMYDYLISRGIIVRNRNKTPLCKGCLRITVGLKDENDRLIESLKAYSR